MRKSYQFAKTTGLVTLSGTQTIYRGGDEMDIETRIEMTCLCGLVATHSISLSGDTLYLDGHRFVRR